MTEFHIRLREIRSKQRKTQKETAEMLGISLRPYQYYEAGKTEPSIKKLIQLADFFHVSVDYLIGRTDA